MSAEIIVNYKKNIAVSQAVVEAKLRADGAENVVIAKVLSIKADSNIVGFEALDGEVVYNGRAILKVMYITDTGECGCLDYSADFSDKIVGADIKPNSELRLSSAVIDTNATTPNMDTIKVSCVIEARAETIMREEMNATTETGDVMTKTETIDFNRFVSGGRHEFVLTNEVEANDEIERICMSETEVLPISAKAIMDSVMLTGKVLTNIVYIPKNGILTSRMFETEFNQEVPAVGVNAESIIDFKATVDKWQVRAETYEGENKTVLRLEFKLVAEVDAFSKAQAEVIADAFSIQFDLQMQNENREYRALKDVANIDCKVEGSAELSEGMPAADRILAVCGSTVNIANCYADTDRIVVEGVLNTAVIYHNKEFENYNSVAVEIPFSVLSAYEGTDADDIIEVRPALTDIVARGSQYSVDVAAGMTFQVLRSAQKNISFVTSITRGEERISDLNAVAIYVARPNQTLWDVAKALSTTPESLLSQNPNLNVPLKGGEKVVIYRQL